MEEQMAVKKKRDLRLRLGPKLAISFASLAIFISALLTFSLYLYFCGKLRQDLHERLHDIASIAALQIDAETHSTLTDPSHEGNAAYMQVKRNLQRIRDAGTNIHFIYTMRQDAKGRIRFIVDAETDPEEIAHLGDVYDDASPMLTNRFETLDHAIVAKDFYSDKWGTWLTGYAPFYRADGQREGVVGVDIAATQVLAREQHFLLVALAIFIASTFMALALGWLLGRKLAEPIVALTAGAERIAGGDLEYEMPLHRVDELGELATVFSRMRRHLRQSLANLQLEVDEHKRSQKELAAYRDNLEDLVQARTEELGSINEELKGKAVAQGQVEDALRESEKRLRTITDTAKDAVIMLNDEGNILYWNPAAQNIFGYTAQEAMGHDLHKLLAPVRFIEDSRFKRGFQRFKESGQGDAIGKTIELEALRKDGTEFPVELSLSAIQTKGRWHAVGIIRDIVERRKMETEREDLILELKEALAKVKTLSGMLPICASCKKIRDDQGYWNQIEGYIRDRSEAEFSHGICPECAKELYPELYEEE